LRRVGAEFHAAQDGRTAMAKATALLEDAAVRRNGTRTPTGASIHLRDVSVTARNGYAPHRLTADVEPGTVTVLTGGNGAGKSTALHTVLGLVVPTSGRVLVGEDDIADLDPRQWWSLIPGTVRENLELFGRISDLDEACRRAGFDEVVAALPNGLDTVLGRDGTGLSLGQRQRLGLARTFGSKRPILLLDEPTAHLDDAREQFVLQSIRESAREGASVLVVGHREVVRAIGDRVITVGGEIHVAH
jgi:ATP-binding cassette subfamily C protein CydD